MDAGFWILDAGYYILNHSMTLPPANLANNEPGQYQVDDACIGCNLCVVLAPYHFRENLDLETKVDSVYILRQPETQAEVSVCRKAMQLCPVDAIKGVLP